MSQSLPRPAATVLAADLLSNQLSCLVSQARTAEALALLESVPDAGARNWHLANALACAVRLPRSGAAVASLFNELLLGADDPDHPEVAAAANAAVVNFLVGLLDSGSGCMYSVLIKLTGRQVAAAFRCCAGAGKEDVALRLLPHLPAPSPPTAAHWLILASERGLPRLLAGLLGSRCLQAAPAVVDAEGVDGRTALTAACLAGQAATARLLLQQGSADPGREDRDGRTCRQLLLQTASAAAETAEKRNSSTFAEIEALLSSTECLGSTQSERDRSRQLHSFLTRCGFTSKQAELHCEAADFLLQRIARPLAGLRSGTRLACHLVGSCAEGWGAGLVQANGRMAVDSDVNWLVGPGPASSEELASIWTEANHAGTLVRSDWQTDRRWPSPHEISRITQLLRGDAGSCGRLTVRQTRELPACFASQERLLIRSLSTVQGQLFTILKIVFKRMLPAMGAAGLTSYHAKTVLFFMLARHYRRRAWWEAENLLPLVRKALNLALELLELDARSCVAMPHFFAENCQLAFRNPSEDTKTRVRESLSALSSDLQRIQTFLRSHLRPLRTRPLYFHPFTLLPVEMFSWESMPKLDSLSLNMFADAYLVVQQCLVDLSLPADDAPVRESMLARARCLPAWCLCSRLCLTALILLRFGNRLKASKVLTALASHGVQRCWDTERCFFFGGLQSKVGAAKASHLNPTNCGDWAWRFCFSSRIRVALKELPNFTRTLLEPRQDSPNSILYVNFHCVAWSLMAELLPKSTASPAEWYTELMVDPDHHELLTLAHYSDSPLHLHFCRTMLEQLRDRTRLDLSSEIESVGAKLDRLSKGSDAWNVKLRPKRMGMSSIRSS